MKWLTKSDYLKFLIHPAYLWLQKYQKDRLPPFGDAAQAIVDAGNAIEECARQLPKYEGGVLVKSLFADSVRETDRYVTAGERVIFQAAVLTDRRLYAKTDVLVRNSDDSWDIHEVKSSTKERTEHINDLAFQRAAFEEYGYIIRNTYLIHINNQYVRRGAVDPSKLFARVDVTAQVDAILSRTRTTIEKALAVIALPECPDDDPLHCSNWYAWRDIYAHLYPEQSKDSIYSLTRLDSQQVRELRKAGVERLDQIPDGFELKPQQEQQLAVIAKGEPIIHPQKIAHHLKKLRFPLYFFDYETVGPGIPLYDGTRPYQQVPFQYSLHVLREPDGELEHYEFLHQGRENPMPDLLAQLRENIGDEGSVIVWYKAFEGGVNEMMAQIYPEYAEFLRGVNQRLYDLMEIFSNFYYVDQRFGGSASIKFVLPALVPELSYKNLAIQKGDAAQRLWEQTATGAITGEAAQKVFEDLKIYCGQDTLAMVKIYDVIMKVKEEAPGAQMSLL